MEQGLFPSYRSLDDPSSLEEERRLCYVGLTRAKEKLFLFHASERRMWGGMREPAIASTFLSEIPEELVKGDIPLSGGATIRREKNLERLTRVDHLDSNKSFLPGAGNAVRKTYSGPSPGKSWSVNDRVEHSSFGEGRVTHVFGSGEKISLAVKFSGMGPKILDPRLAPLKLIDEQKI